MTRYDQELLVQAGAVVTTPAATKAADNKTSEEEAAALRRSLQKRAETIDSSMEKMTRRYGTIASVFNDFRKYESTLVNNNPALVADALLVSLRHLPAGGRHERKALAFLSDSLERLSPEEDRRISFSLANHVNFRKFLVHAKRSDSNPQLEQQIIAELSDKLQRRGFLPTKPVRSLAA